VGRLKIGVIGCGGYRPDPAFAPLRELDTEFEIGGLADLSPRFARHGRDHYGYPGTTFIDYNDMLQTDIDGVIVCPSPSTRPTNDCRRRARKHVFVEKPMCTTVREAEAMVAGRERRASCSWWLNMKRHEPAYRCSSGSGCVR